MDALVNLERGHARLMTKAEALYSSLNVPDRFPELTNIGLKFVQILFMARDLKINIHRRAIGSFFEWDKLDHAVGGKDKPLGVCPVTCSEPTIRDINRYQTSSTNLEGHRQNVSPHLWLPSANITITASNFLNFIIPPRQSLYLPRCPQCSLAYGMI